ncbi:hypothetical protein, partial [Salmonella enterica]|uniref:hypothetical protein n=1 Tax=Salmonella enterica TaxID=28901 RepID=UPI003D2C7963
ILSVVCKLSVTAKYYLAVMLQLIGFSATAIIFIFLYKHSSPLYFLSPVGSHTGDVNIFSKISFIISAIVFPAITILYFVFLLKNIIAFI